VVILVLRGEHALEVGNTVMKRPPVMIFLSGRVSGRGSEPSRARVGDGSRDGIFCGWRLGYLGFF
jgi:hypothetical protein